MSAVASTMPATTYIPIQTTYVSVPSTTTYVGQSSAMPVATWTQAPTTTTFVGKATYQTSSVTSTQIGASAPTTTTYMGGVARPAITVSAEFFEKAKQGNLTQEEINELASGIAAMSTTHSAMAAVPVDTNTIP